MPFSRMVRDMGDHAATASTWPDRAAVVRASASMDSAVMSSMVRPTEARAVFRMFSEEVPAA